MYFKEYTAAKQVMIDAMSTSSKCQMAERTGVSRSPRSLADYVPEEGPRCMRLGRPVASDRKHHTAEAVRTSFGSRLA